MVHLDKLNLGMVLVAAVAAEVPLTLVLVEQADKERYAYGPGNS